MSDVMFKPAGKQIEEIIKQLKDCGCRDLCVNASEDKANRRHEIWASCEYLGDVYKGEPVFLSLLELVSSSDKNDAALSKQAEAWNSLLAKIRVAQSSNSST